MAKARNKAKNKAKAAVAKTPADADVQPDDSMSRCVALCQELRWREAAILSRQMLEKAERSGKSELANSLAGAALKIEYSLRRQMAVAVTHAARQLLNKEYLLDVGQ